MTSSCPSTTCCPATSCPPGAARWAGSTPRAQSRYGSRLQGCDGGLFLDSLEGREHLSALLGDECWQPSGCLLSAILATRALRRPTRMRICLDFIEQEKLGLVFMQGPRGDALFADHLNDHLKQAAYVVKL